MAGRRIFVAGEILTAANVQSFLQDQAVMVFDDDTARGSAIPSPTEGMVTYLKDTDNVEKYNGAAFVPVGGLVKVSSVALTSVFSASVASGGSTAITGLSLTHEIAQSGNKVLLFAQIGQTGNSTGASTVGISFAEDGTSLNVGDTGGDRTSVSAGQTGAQLTEANTVGSPLQISFLHSPSTGSKVYTVRAHNASFETSTVFINRSGSDTETESRIRAASTLTLMEVAG